MWIKRLKRFEAKTCGQRCCNRGEARAPVRSVVAGQDCRSRDAQASGKRLQDRRKMLLEPPERVCLRSKMPIGEATAMNDGEWLSSRGSLVGLRRP